MSSRFETHLDGREIDVRVDQIDTAEDIASFVGLLRCPSRRSPVIGISVSEGGEPLVDADRLTREVFGTAHVALLSRDAGFQLTQLLDKRLSVYNGAVRLWLIRFSQARTILMVILLDMPLKSGNSREPRYCFRLYFFWSDQHKRVVVGSFPGHLTTGVT